MAWNEPGRGDHDKDPWGKGEGPPNLDEVFRRLKKKLMQLFSNAKASGRSSSNSSFGNQGNGAGNASNGNSSSKDNANSASTSALPFGDMNFTNGAKAVSGIIVLLYLLSGIYIVEPAEEVVITRLGRYHRTIGEGPHWFARFIEEKSLINVSQVHTTDHKGAMLTKDENIVEVEIAVQYSIGNSKDYLFNVVDPVFNLNQIIDSALRYVIGHSTLEEVLTSGRTQVALQIKALIETILNSYQAGIIISDVAMQPARAPENVKSAFDDAIRAQEDEIRLMNQADAYSRSMIPIAEGKARRLIEEAQAYELESVFLAKGETQRFLAVLPHYQASPAVTRDRLYFSTMEKILGRVSKVVVDSEKGQNLTLLPLDKLLSSRASKADMPVAVDRDLPPVEVKEEIVTRSAGRTSDRPQREQGN